MFISRLKSSLETFVVASGSGKESEASGLGGIDVVPFNS